MRAAVPEAVTALCRSCHALTGGNPFFLRELAGALREAGPERAGDVLGAAPDGVVASVRARLDALSRVRPSGSPARPRSWATAR